MTVVVDRTFSRLQREEDLLEWARRLVDELHQRLYEVGIDLNASTAVNLHNLLSTTHSDTVTGAASQGAIIYGNSTPAWTKLGAGSNDDALQLKSGIPAWRSMAQFADDVEGSINHINIANIGSNAHSVIDTHIADSTLHFVEGAVDHVNILSIGSNTHAQVDTHIAATSGVHGATGTIVGTTDTQTLSAKTLTTPTIVATGWTNANHAHAAANSGGQVGISNVSGMAANVAAWLADPTSAKLITAVTDEEGSGHLVFDTSPTFDTSILTPLIIGPGGTGNDLVLQSNSANDGKIDCEDKLGVVTNGYTFDNDAPFPSGAQWSVLSCLNFLNQGTITLSGVYPTFMCISAFGTVNVTESHGYIAGMGYLMSHNLLYTNDDGKDPGSVFVYNDGGQLSVDCISGNRSAWYYRSFMSRPKISRGAGANGFTLSQQLSGFYSEATVNAGCTVATRYGLNVVDAAGTGTITTQVGVDVGVLTKGGTNISFRSAAAGAEMRHAGPAIFGANAAVGTGVVEIQNASGQDRPCLLLDQDDADSPFMVFEGGSAGDLSTNITTLTTEDIAGHIRIKIGADVRWIPFSTTPA